MVFATASNEGLKEIKKENERNEHEKLNEA
jgi:hypothetical protein